MGRWGTGGEGKGLSAEIWHCAGRFVGDLCLAERGEVRDVGAHGVASSAAPLKIGSWRVKHGWALRTI